MADYLEGIYADLSKKFNYQTKGPILVEVFNNHEMFSGRVTALPDLHTIGACTGTMFAMVSPHTTVTGTAGPVTVGTDELQFVGFSNPSVDQLLQLMGLAYDDLLDLLIEKAAGEVAAGRPFGEDHQQRAAEQERPEADRTAQGDPAGGQQRQAG